MKVFSCENCRRDFRAYFLNEKLSHTIPKSLSNIQLSVSKYIAINNQANADQIAENLELPLIEVLSALKNLERKGIVERIVMQSQSR